MQRREAPSGGEQIASRARTAARQKPSSARTRSTDKKAATKKTARKGVRGVVSGAAKGVSKRVGALRASAREAVSDTVLRIVGLLTLGSVLLGGLVLYWLSRGPLLR